MEKSGFLMVGCFNDYFTSRFVWNSHLELVDIRAHLKWKCYETKILWNEHDWMINKKIKIDISLKSEEKRDK